MKVYTECRVFNKTWTAKYFFTEVKDEAMCLVCDQTRRDVAAVKASYVTTHKLTRNSKAISDGKFIK